jgi:hypothetical protein
MTDPSPQRALNVFIRDVMVHDDHDPGPGKGEVALHFEAVAVPTTPGGRASATWQASVKERRVYEVGLWLGIVAVPSEGGMLTVVGAGTEHDPGIGTPLWGGLATLSHQHDWENKWWRTTNGRDFDFTFCIMRAAEASDSGRPLWTGETYDAPGTERPAPASYRTLLGE